TLSAYRELGGVKGALAKQAEETYTTLPSEEHRKLARALFVRLIDPGATEQDTTRRRAALSEFTLDDPIQTRLMRETIDTFIGVRLLTTNEIAGTTTIEVSHEALIREWKRLADWMREARQDIPLQQAISEDVAEWERHGKPRDRLYRGSQLKEAQAWATRNRPSGNEVAFLRTSALYRVGYRLSMTAIFLLLISTDGLLVGPYLELKITQLMRAYPTGIPILPTGTPILALLIYDILLSPVVLVAFVCLWAFPLVARFWRKQVKTPTGSNWAFPGTSSQHVVLPPQDPFRLRFALTVGLVGGLVFCGLLLLIRIGVRLSIPEAIRGNYQFRIILTIIQIVLAALIQATAAGIVAGWVRRLGSQHGLFAAFVGGCVMTVGFLGLNLLFGGTAPASFIWIIFSSVINAGALLAWPIALIVSVIVHRVVAHVRRIARLRL
ncbi:MAG TPA: hypothetical protein VFN02_03055, partial [Ktedonobacteraceae bacterium]|nr:hypothetical protein [Ktedonobacteraceae bacterium]